MNGTPHKEPYKQTALDRLEEWFGLNGANHQNIGVIPSAAKPRGKSQYKPTRLVLVHTVAPVDSLESLALRYNTDVRTLRKANGLWPNDSVQVRKEVYIPVDEERVVQGQSSVLRASEGDGGKLSLLNGEQEHEHSVPTPNTASLRRIPTHSLSYFPPPATKGKGKEEDAFGYGEGIKPDPTLDPGESGVEDLLHLAERARLRGASTSEVEAHREHNASHSIVLGPEDSVSVASSPEQSSKQLEEPWKPNKWTLGQRRHHKSTSRTTSTASSEGSSSRQEHRGPAMMASGSRQTTRSSDYQGWNDIPEPPLHRTAKGQVAHAYKPKKRYPQIGGSHTLELPGSALIDDLAAGLPANPGPAAHWARPIADCLPLPAETHSHPSSHQPTGAPSATGWRQILSDTMRGKMRLEDALERGIDDLRQGILTSADARPATMLPVHRSESPSSTASHAPRRGSGRSLHELQELQAQADQQDSQYPSSQTWSASSATNIRGRRNVRTVDWLS